MKLRRLKSTDAKRMHQWMHDENVTFFLYNDFSHKTIADCMEFISNSYNTESINMAIADDEDTYLGTVSLKHIQNKKAEFAIVVCKDAMGKGVSKFAMNEIMKIAFDELELDEVYWCVARQNERAIRFYDKNGFAKVNHTEIETTYYTEEQKISFLWYQEKR